MTLAARPTTYDGIEMRSRLEARFAAFLDRSELNWEYEPRAYASARGQYLPDFVIDDKVFLEVKGAWLPSRAERDALGSRMAIIWASRPDAWLGCLYEASFQEGHYRFAGAWLDAGLTRSMWLDPFSVR